MSNKYLVRLGMVLIGIVVVAVVVGMTMQPAAPATSTETPTALTLTSTSIPPGVTNTPPTIDKIAEVTILYGTEKAAWLQPLVTQFNSEQHQTTTGYLIVVKATGMGSVQAASAIIDEKEKATVWFPASSLYVPVAQEDWKAKHNSELFTDEPTSILSSPVVIAMWKPLAEKLGWPTSKIGWKTLHDDFGKNWSDLGGLSEWGRFQLAYTDPRTSNSGLSAELAQLYVGASKRQGLTVSDIDTPAVLDFLRQFQGNSTVFESSTGFLSKKLLDCKKSNPSFLSGAVVYENLVAIQPQDCPDAQRLVAILPSDGTFWSDHPFIVLNADWVKPEQKEAAEMFKQFLLAEPQQNSAMVTGGFRPVNLDISLGSPLEPGNGIALNTLGPETNQFELPSAEVVKKADEIPLSVKVVKPIDVVLLIDTSESMSASNKISDAKKAATDFIDILLPTDSLQIMTFDTRPKTLWPLSVVGLNSSIKGQMTGVVNGIAQLSGQSCLYSVLIQAYNGLSKEGDSEHVRAIILLSDWRSDGESASCAEKSNDLTALLKSDQATPNPVKIFTIAYGAEADSQTLQQIAAAFGGEFYKTKPDDSQSLYNKIAEAFEAVPK
jgi:Ca-activated chloride channel family protein